MVRALTATCTAWGAEYVTDKFIERRHSRSGRSSAGSPGTLGLSTPGRGPVLPAIAPSSSAAAGGRAAATGQRWPPRGAARRLVVLLIIFVLLFIVWLAAFAACVVIYVDCDVWYGARERKREAQESKNLFFLWCSCGPP